MATDWIQFGRGRKINHFLHLRHVADLNTIQNIHALLDCVNFVSVEIGGALLELGEILHGTQAALGTKNLLIEDPPQAYCVEPEASLLRTDIWRHMELPGGVEVYVAIQACNAEARLFALAVVGRIELLLGKWSH